MRRMRSPGLGRDRAGQMMILSAVILLLAFIALAGMVARVSQLASATTSESDRVILAEIGPLSTAMDQAICRIKASTTTNKVGTADFASGATSISDIKNGIALAATDVGMTVTGVGIPAGTRILSVDTIGSTATISQATTAIGADRAVTLVPCLAPGVTTTFNLAGTGTTPRAQDAVAEILEHIEAIEEQHGFFLDASVSCWTGLAGQGRAVLELSDGTVWIQVRSTVPLPMAPSSGC